MKSCIYHPLIPHFLSNKSNTFSNFIFIIIPRQTRLPTKTGILVDLTKLLRSREALKFEMKCSGLKKLFIELKLINRATRIGGFSVGCVVFPPRSFLHQKSGTYWSPKMLLRDKRIDMQIYAHWRKIDYASIFHWLVRSWPCISYEVCFTFKLGAPVGKQIGTKSNGAKNHSVRGSRMTIYILDVISFTELSGRNSSSNCIPRENGSIGWCGRPNGIID